MGFGHENIIRNPSTVMKKNLHLWNKRITPDPMCRIVWCILWSLMSMSIAIAQFKYESLSSSQGLSQGYVSNIFQDSDGFLWISTKDGLNRYDGYTFKVFTHDALDPHSISDNFVNDVMEDSKGRLWVATNANGINIYDKLSGKFHRLIHDEKLPNSLSGHRVPLPIVELADGRFITSASDQWLDVITIGDDFFDRPSDVHIQRIPTPIRLETIVRDAKNRVWVSGGSAIYRFFPESGKIELQHNDIGFNQALNNSDGTMWINSDVLSLMDGDKIYPVFDESVVLGEGNFIHKESNGRMWLSISNKKKLLTYDLSQWKRGQPIRPSDVLIGQDDNVGAMRIIKDRSGLLWLATNGYGIRKYTFESEKFNHVGVGMSIRKVTPHPDGHTYLRGWGYIKRLTKDGIVVDDNTLPGRIHDYYVARNGDIWLQNYTKVIDGKPNMQGIKRYQKSTGQWTEFPIEQKFIYEEIQPIMEDRQGQIWVSGLNSKYAIIDPKSGATVHYSVNTNKDHLNLKNAQFTAMYEDLNGVVWIGTEQGLVSVKSNHFMSQAPTTTWYKNKQGDPSSLNFNHVTCIIDDPRHVQYLWVGTKGGGLNRLDKKTGKFIHITTRQGLCNNVVYGILPDNDGNIWGSTNKGIFCLLHPAVDAKTAWEFRHFTNQAGLQDDEFNTHAYAMMPNGDLAFGGVNGLNVFNPAKILVDSFRPNVFITQLLVGNKPVHPRDETSILQTTIEYTESIELDHSQDVFTLEFASLDFRAPDQNKYRYMMDRKRQSAHRHLLTSAGR
jgi:ligand-binding sensor domain-containing protein